MRCTLRTLNYVTVGADAKAGATCHMRGNSYRSGSNVSAKPYEKNTHCWYKEKCKKRRGARSESHLFFFLSTVFSPILWRCHFNFTSTTDTLRCGIKPATVLAVTVDINLNHMKRCKTKAVQNTAQRKLLGGHHIGLELFDVNGNSEQNPRTCWALLSGAEYI